MRQPSLPPRLTVQILGALGLISTTRLTTICTLTFAILAVIISVIGESIIGRKFMIIY